MPIYEYKCLTCNEDFDELIRSSEQEKNVRCPHCQGSLVERKISLFGFASASGSVSSVAGATSCGTCVSKHCATCG